MDQSFLAPSFHHFYATGQEDTLSNYYDNYVSLEVFFPIYLPPNVRYYVSDCL